jgi:hypothetical protein
MDIVKEIFESAIKEQGFMTSKYDEREDIIKWESVHGKGTWFSKDAKSIPTYPRWLK